MTPSEALDITAVRHILVVLVVRIFLVTVLFFSTFLSGRPYNEASDNVWYVRAQSFFLD